MPLAIRSQPVPYGNAFPELVDAALRLTFITEALAAGTPLAIVQAAAVHARGETTLRYAQAVDARTARKTLKLRYG